MAALARKAGVRYALVRRVCSANARGDDLGSTGAIELGRLLLACGHHLVITTTPGSVPLAV